MSANATPPGAKPDLNPFGEAMDSYHFELFESTGLKIDLPVIFGYPVSKFEVLLAATAVIVGLLLLWLGAKMRRGDTPRGVLWNFLEAILYFVRDDIARPAIGEHDGDKYLPYLTTTFLFVLIANLMGMIPFLGSPTASIAVTAALALISFLVTHISGIQQMGFAGYAKSFVPHIEIEGPAKVMGVFLVPLIMFLELLTPFIRVFVLAVRLFANMLAGHTALFMLLYFIRMVSDPAWLSYHQMDNSLHAPVAIVSVLLVTAMSLLELMVAALQAFIFTLLTAIFIGLAKHPAH